MEYDYKVGKERIIEILDNDVEVENKKYVPCENDFTFDNAYKCWITPIFVDIRNSTELFNSSDKKKVTKIVRSFTSEIIEILNAKCILDKPYEDISIEEIGIRGDCVYAVYSTPQQSQIYEVLDRAFYINTLIKMLNELFGKYKLDSIKAGIGVSVAEEIIIKAGRKYSGVNSKVWIGDAVTKASKLSGLGDKGNIQRIVISSCMHHNIINKFKKRNGEEKATSYFTKVIDNKLGTYYHCDIIKTDFNDWINGGMK